MTSSDEVGRTTQKLSAFCVSGGIDDWFEIQHKGKKSGMLHLKGNFKPHSATGQAAHATNAAIANTMGMFGAYGAQPKAPPVPMGMYPPQ